MINWDIIKYIFQIPISWYKDIHKKVFGAYGTNFIRVRDGEDGAMHIDVDEESFKAAVAEASGSGTVKSVDNVMPDDNGNVELGAVTLSGDQTIYGTKTFASNVYLSSQPGLPDANSLALATVGHVNTFYARKSHDHGNLNNDGTITNSGADITADYIIGADANGNLYRKSANDFGLVKSVNGETPDANGNVTINSGSVESVNGIGPDQNGNVYLGALVKTVNNIQPDINGNVTIDISSITMEDVEDYIAEQNFVTEDTLDNYALTSDLANYALTSDLDNYALTSDLDNYALTSDLADYAHTVDGHQAVNGVVNFGLYANKWMKTDGAGHIATTDEVPAAVGPNDTGYLYADGGNLQFKNEDYVTLTSNQDITGAKTILNNDFTIVGQSLLVKDSAATGTGTSVSKNGITINSPTPFIDFSNPGTAANDTFIAMTAASGYRLGVQSPHGIDLDAPVNQAKLAVQPTDTTTASLAIATCGYVQSQLSGYSTGSNQLKIVTDVTWNGTTLQKKTRNVTIKNGLITQVGSETTTTIDTPTVITWA